MLSEESTSRRRRRRSWDAVCPVRLHRSYGQRAYGRLHYQPMRPLYLTDKLIVTLMSVVEDPTGMTLNLHNKIIANNIHVIAVSDAITG
jgi:hypothetical protein